MVDRVIPHHPPLIINLPDVTEQDTVALCRRPHTFVDAVINVGLLVKPLQHVKLVDRIYNKHEPWYSSDQQYVVCDFWG